MLVACTTKCSITNTQRANLARRNVGSLGPSTFLTETKLYTTTESPSGEPFAIDQRYFRDEFRVPNPTSGGSRWANWNPAFGRDKGCRFTLTLYEPGFWETRLRWGNGFRSCTKFRKHAVANLEKYTGQGNIVADQGKNPSLIPILWVLKIIQKLKSLFIAKIHSSKLNPRKQKIH